jgi:uncharacterized protein YeeX (DUF496 family)
MAEKQEHKPRIKKVQEYLYNAEEPTKAKEIAEKLGENKLNVGKDLQKLKDKKFAEMIGDGLWRLTDDGRIDLETGGKKGGEESGGGIPESDETVPSQADIFRDIGERLGIGKGKGEVKLDPIIYYVQRTANLDNLDTIWNALTEMGVAADVRKRWLKLYAQTIPGKKITEELKEKLDAGSESEKLPKPGAEGEIQPKPKRFSVVNGQMIGDPEGDYTFKEALQLIATTAGVPADQANPLATMLEAMKLGPEMATATMAQIIPYLTKDKSEVSGDNVWLQMMQSQQQQNQQQIQMLQNLITSLTEDKHKAEMDAIRAEMKSGQRPPETDQQIAQLGQQVRDLTESLHQQQLVNIQEQNKAMIDALQGNIQRLQDQVAAAAQGRRTEGSLGIIEKALDAANNQLTGIRTDAKPFIETALKSGGPGPTAKTAADKQRITSAGKAAVEHERKAQSLEDVILGS